MSTICWPENWIEAAAKSGLAIKHGGGWLIEPAELRPKLQDFAFLVSKADGDAIEADHQAEIDQLRSIAAELAGALEGMQEMYVADDHADIAFNPHCAACAAKVALARYQEMIKP